MSDSEKSDIRLLDGLEICTLSKTETIKVSIGNHAAKSVPNSASVLALRRSGRNQLHRLRGLHCKLLR